MFDFIVKSLRYFRCVLTIVWR